jgi:Papain fold toxin 2
MLEVSLLTDHPEDSALTQLYEAIGNLVIRFPLLHCEECASTLQEWLKQRGIPGKLWRLSTRYDDEDFILSAIADLVGCVNKVTHHPP